MNNYKIRIHKLVFGNDIILRKGDVIIWSFYMRSFDNQYAQKNYRISNKFGNYLSDFGLNILVSEQKKYYMLDDERNILLKMIVFIINPDIIKPKKYHEL